jgi:ATP-dependent DNA ligase
VTRRPAGRDWLHEIKHDGYRLVVQRDNKRVRLWTRNGHDWSDRFPLITEAALRNRNSSLIIDGEAVLLGVDGRSDFNGLHSRGTMRATAKTSAGYRYQCARPTWPGCWRAASTASF